MNRIELRQFFALRRIDKRHAALHPGEVHAEVQALIELLGSGGSLVRLLRRFEQASHSHHEDDGGRCPYECMTVRELETRLVALDEECTAMRCDITSRQLAARDLFSAMERARKEERGAAPDDASCPLTKADGIERSWTSLRKETWDIEARLAVKEKNVEHLKRHLKLRKVN